METMVVSMAVGNVDGGKCGFWTLGPCNTEEGAEEQVWAVSQPTELSHHAGQSHQTPLPWNSAHPMAGFKCTC